MADQARTLARSGIPRPREGSRGTPAPHLPNLECQSTKSVTWSLSLMRQSAAWAGSGGEGGWESRSSAQGSTPDCAPPTQGAWGLTRE